MRTRSPIPGVFVALLAAGLLAGCGKSADPIAPAAPTTTPESADQTAITDVMGQVPVLAEDDLFLSEEETELSLAANAALGRPSASPAAAIRPWRYWREILDVDRRFEFEFFAPDSNGDPTRAFVTIHKSLKGTFNILTPTPAPSDTTPTDGALATSDGPGPGPIDRADLRLVRKRLHDHWVRRIALVRIDPPNSDRHVWRIAGTSGVSVESVAPSATDTRIQSLRIQKAGLDSTVTDPLELFRLKQILRAVPGEQVTLTVTTNATDDVVVLLHRGLRFRFTNNGDGTYTGVWTVPPVLGIHHFGVNALSHGTLFDDEAPYSSDAWILPYATTPVTVDEMP